MGIWRVLRVSVVGAVIGLARVPWMMFLIGMAHPDPFDLQLERSSLLVAQQESNGVDPSVS